MSRVVELAESCIGTPFHHQGRLPGVGLDCVGLVIWIGQQLGIAYPDNYRYGRNPNGREMGRLLAQYLLRVETPQPGDVLHIAWARLPQHLGIYAPQGRLIHAYEPRGVIVTTLSGRHLAGVQGCFRFPGA